MVDSSFCELYEKALSSKKYFPIYQGAIVNGKVIAINNKFVTINSFLKSDGFIPIFQFKDDNGLLEVNIGSDVEVVIESLDDSSGEIKLSRDKAKRVRAWEKLENVYKNNDTIIGYIASKIKGGFTVKLDVIKGFLPGSLIAFKSDVNSDEIKGKKMKFKIIKLEKKKNNVVVSQRFIPEDKNSKNFQNLLSFDEGSIVSGFVKNITDYGVFIDLGGIDGLLHITDMSWKRVKHPNNLVKIGETIKVKILKFDKSINRISLGLKQLLQDPWKNIKEKYKENDIINGKVTNITDYGCFVEIEDGIEGLIHSSEMNWVNKNVNPNKIVKQGMEIKVKILDINLKKRRISLGLKQCVENPWISFNNKYFNNNEVYGKVKSVTDFGLFLELSYGIDGLLHIGDISWEPQNDFALKIFKRTDEIKVIILNIDIERERIFLSLKHFAFEQYLFYIKKYIRGNFVNCKISKKFSVGCNVNLFKNLNGFLKFNGINNINSFLLNHIIKSKIFYIDKKIKNILFINK